jgi:hypothetical protein
VSPRLPAWHLALALVLIACGDETTAPLSDCPEAVELTVGAGLQPVFDWAPRCLAATLIVEARDGTGFTMWILQTVDQENHLSPPIRYGDEPEGTEQIGDLRPLIAGSLYRVGLMTVFPTSNGGITLDGVAVAEFQR